MQVAKPKKDPANPRSNSGSVAEMAPVLFVIFFLFVIPMINIGCLATRYALAMTACREAAHQAAVAYTFQTGSAGRPSAMDACDQAILNTVAKFSGITVASKDLDIIATNINTQAINRYPGKLTSPANTQTDVFSLETNMVVDLDPLIAYNGPFLSNIPGLTGPYRVNLYAREYAENPQGLNQ